MMKKNWTKYTGRTFEFGIDDCYSLVREFYKDEFNIELTNYARYDKWWEDGLNMYIDNMKPEGFYVIENGEEPQVGDLYLMALNSPVASHAAIYLGENKILHHVQGRLSTIENYRGIWRNYTVCRCRHKNNKNLERERIVHEFK